MIRKTTPAPVYFLWFASLFMAAAIARPSFGGTDVRVYSGKALQSLKLTNTSGEIEVRPSEDGRVHLTIDKVEFEGCKDLEIDFDLVSLNIDVKERPGNSKCEVNFALLIPDSINVDIKSGFGTIIGEGMKNDFRVKNGAGNIHLKNVDLNNLDAKTGAGNIHVSGAVIHTKIKSGAGNVNLTLHTIDPEGKIDIKTGAGNSTVKLPKESLVSAELSSAIGNTINDFLKGSGTTSGQNAAKPLSRKTFKVSVKSGMGNVAIRGL